MSKVSAKKTALPTKATKKAAPLKEAAAKPAARAKVIAPPKPIKAAFNKSSLVAHLAELAAGDGKGREGCRGFARGDYPRVGSQEGPGLVAGPAERQRHQCTRQEEAHPH